MEINDALVTAITRELLKRLGDGETLSVENVSFPEKKDPVISGQGDVKRKKVINEAELMRLCPASMGQGQSIEIGSRDILTPLAMDYITRMRITVNRSG